RRWGVDDEHDAIPVPMSVGGLVEGDDGLVWMLNGEALVQARDLEGRVVASFGQGDGLGLEQDENVKSLLRGPDGRIWIGTTRGLRRMADDGSRWEPVPGAARGVTSAVATDGGRVWVTGTGSLSAWEWDGGKLRQTLALGPREGLPQVPFSGVVADLQGNLWLTSTRGLVRVDATDNSIRSWGVGDGLPSQHMDNPPLFDPVSRRIL